jgi:DNA-binding transcriptional LysR family regulator
MDRVTTMATFVKVGFSAAARVLDTSPSRVTKEVQRLERLLGARLLNRTTRSVCLTEVGRAYYQRCVHILAELEDADQMAQGLHATPRGTLRLNVSMMMPHLVNPVVDEFSTLHPDAAIEMVISERLLDLVAQGFDLALHSAPIAESSLIARRLAVDHMVICGAPDYFSARGMPKHPSDLSHHNCLLFTPSPWAEEWTYRDEDGEHRVPVSGNLRANSAVALRLAALRGQGLLAAQSFYVAEDIAAGRLIPILAKHTQQEFPILAIYPHRHQVSAKVRSFIDLLARHLRHAPVRALHRPSRQAA